jgi:hypothetical protein
MKKILFSAFLIASVSVPDATARDHAVRGHVKKDGTYVAPTRATNPNSSQRDNYSSTPNINPANGKQGTKEPVR